jgi:hypothetical protein
MPAKTPYGEAAQPKQKCMFDPCSPMYNKLIETTHLQQALTLVADIASPDIQNAKNQEVITMTNLYGQLCKSTEDEDVWQKVKCLTTLR